MKRRDRSELLSVYVAGEIGDRAVIVAYSLETAIIRLLAFYSLSGQREDSGYPEQWICRFTSDEPGDLLWTLTLVVKEKTHALYIEKHDIEEDEWDSETGWRI